MNLKLCEFEADIADFYVATLIFYPLISSHSSSMCRLSGCISRMIRMQTRCRVLSLEFPHTHTHTHTQCRHFARKVASQIHGRVEAQSGPVRTVKRKCGNLQCGSNPSTLHWKQYTPVKHKYPLEHCIMS